MEGGHHVPLDTAAATATIMVPTRPEKFLKVLESFSPFRGLKSSGNQCRFCKVLEIWCESINQSINQSIIF